MTNQAKSGKIRILEKDNNIVLVWNCNILIKVGKMLKFIKQHKILSLLFIVSIFLMIKNSKIPYPFDPPVFVSFIFDSPKGDFFSGVMQMLDIFASAYVTSLIFYLLTEYIPAQKENKKAKEIIAPKLADLYSYISELLAMIEYAAKKEKIFPTNNIDDMDNLHIDNKTIFCKQKSFINGIEGGTIPYSYNLVKDLYQYKSLIMKACSEISCTPSFSYCDNQIVHIISEIQLSELLFIIQNPNNPMLQLDYVENFYNGLGEKYSQLVSIYRKIDCFVDTKHTYQMIDISTDEIEKWKKEETEKLHDNPMLKQFLIDMQCAKK